jgi:hypothetical protein
MRSEPDAMARAAGFSMLWAAAAGFGRLSRLRRPSSRSRDGRKSPAHAAEETITNPGSTASGSGFRRVESGSVKASYWTRFFFKRTVWVGLSGGLIRVQCGNLFGHFRPLTMLTGSSKKNYANRPENIRPKKSEISTVRRIFKKNSILKSNFSKRWVFY